MRHSLRTVLLTSLVVAPGAAGAQTDTTTAAAARCAAWAHRIAQVLDAPVDLVAPTRPQFPPPGPATPFTPLPGLAVDTVVVQTQVTAAGHVDTTRLRFEPALGPADRARVVAALGARRFVPDTLAGCPVPRRLLVGFRRPGPES